MEASIHVRLCTTKNSDLFTDVMKLRYEAYFADSRLTWQSSWADMHDEWDERSIIAAAYLNGQISGSIRVTVNNRADVLSYPSLYIKNNLENADHKATRITPDLYVESSRLCISPQCRGQGLWYQLAAYMVAIANKTGRRYIVGSAIDELVPTWCKIGFNKTGYRYHNSDIGGQIHEMMFLDVSHVLENPFNKAFHQIVQAAVCAPLYEDKEVQAILFRSW